MLSRSGNRHHLLRFLIQRFHRRHLTSDGMPHELRRSTEVNGTKSVSLVFILGTWSCWPSRHSCRQDIFKSKFLVTRSHIKV
ncbi:unnamed protein product [Lactuca virosa]|uniref:Uncharacterized protein n=1 Tax=Lactuca virosa TaxID=75947 RepID=A0AAU9LTH4_9ASTR|nr:unnamed protein product [Lactuca virosa]